MSEKMGGQYVKLDKPRKIVKSLNFYKYYTRNSKFKGPKKDGKLTKDELWILAGRFFEKVGDHMVNNKAGVFLKGLGYFVPFLYIKKKKAKKVFQFLNILEDNYFYDTEGHFYFLDFHPIKRKNSPLGSFSLEGYVSGKLKSKFKKRLKEGYRYKLKYSLLKQFYG